MTKVFVIAQDGIVSVMNLLSGGFSSTEDFMVSLIPGSTARPVQRVNQLHDVDQNGGRSICVECSRKGIARRQDFNDLCLHQVVSGRQQRVSISARDTVVLESMAISLERCPLGEPALAFK